MKVIIRLFIITVLFSSCCDIPVKTTYTYNGVTITRLDKCDNTSFYYGEGKAKYKGRIWAEYSGINDGFRGYLQFQKNGKVRFLVGDGYFQSEKLDSTVFKYSYLDAYSDLKMDRNVCHVYLTTEYEKVDNYKMKTGVVIKYEK